MTPYDRVFRDRRDRALAAGLETARTFKRGSFWTAAVVLGTIGLGARIALLRDLWSLAAFAGYTIAHIRWTVWNRRMDLALREQARNNGGMSALNDLFDASCNEERD